MIRSLARTGVLALGALALDAGAQSFAQSTPGATPGPAFEITATWSGDDEPTAMWIEQGPSRLALTRSGQAFSGRAPIGAVLLTRRATLVAAYGGELVTLPVRFVPSDPVMEFSVHAARPTACVDSAIRRLETPGSTYSAQVQAYFTAKKLVALTGRSACVPLTRARVVKAWFDRSYSLARDNAHIAIDTEAAEALKKIPAQQAYAERMEREILTQGFGLDYNASRRLAAHGAFVEALATNQALTQSLEADDALAQAVAEVQKVNAARLSMDRDFLAARAEAEAVTNGGGEAAAQPTLEPPPE